MAFSGVLVLRNVEKFNLSDKTLWGDLLQVLNCLSYAFFLAYGKKFLETHDRLWATGWMFTYGSVGLTLLSVSEWESFAWPPMTTELWWCMVFAVVGGTLLTYFLNNWALAKTHSSHVALFIYIQPVVASMLAWAWKGENPTLRTYASSAMIFLGMYLSLFQRSAFNRVDGSVR
jgi:drug/metabolite transporter (DMT)-like permease